MKKMFLLLASLTCLLFVSCASMGAAKEPLDQGYYPIGEESETSVEILVEGNLLVTGIDEGNDFSMNMFSGPVKGWKAKWSPAQEQVFRLKPGVHTVNVKFDNGKQYALMSTTLIVNFVEGNQYKITYAIDGSSVKYDCINVDTQESAKLDMAAMQGTGGSVMSNFIAAVLNPTMDEVGQTVIQENDDYILTTYPALKFELYNKKTGVTESGMRTFITDFSFKSGTVYFYVTDMTDKDEFLNSGYKNSQYVFTVTACDKKTVTYTYQKPEDKAGQTITFNISVKE